LGAEMLHEEVFLSLLSQRGLTLVPSPKEEGGQTSADGIAAVIKHFISKKLLNSKKHSRKE
jgi:hypothetical protein